MKLEEFVARGLAGQKAVDELDVVAIVKRAHGSLMTAASIATGANSATEVRIGLEAAAIHLEKVLRALGHPL